MKTIIFSNSQIRVEVKTDIVATIEELQTPGFDTRFTNMDIQGYTDEAKTIFNIREVENGWQAAIAMTAAVTTDTLIMSILDVSANAQLIEITTNDVTLAKISLQALIDSTSDLVEADYTAPTWSTFENTLASALAVIADQTITDAALVEGEQEDLQDAIDDLVEA